MQRPMHAALTPCGVRRTSSARPPSREEDREVVSVDHGAPIDVRRAVRAGTPRPEDCREVG